MFARTAVAAFVAVPLLASTAFAASCTRSYTVKEGDWCDTISAANNVSTYQLSAVNPEIDDLCHNLQVGQNLCLGTKGEDCTTTYVVKPNDSCELLTGTFNINSTILYHNNPQLEADCSNLYVGEVICVAGSALAPAPPAGPLPTAIPSTAVPAVSKSTPTATASAGGDENDDDLPFCDEL